MTIRSGGTALVEALVAQGVSTVFGVPGESYLAVLDGLYGAKDSIKTVMARNEGGAAFMAEAYGKLTGEPGICMVTRGPGATNASIGVHTAMQNSTPMVLFIGQIGRSMKGREAFQEVDYGKFFGDVAKWVAEIDDVDRIPELVARAFHVAQSGRPGPVVLALPEDMLRDQTEVPVVPRVTPVQADISAVALDQIAAELDQAKQPLLLIGGSGWSDDGKAAVRSFAEKNDLPVVATFRYQDLLDNHSPSYAGDTGVGVMQNVKDLMTNADVILAVGTRFGENTTDGYTLFDMPMPKQRVLHIHASEMELFKVIAPAMAVQAGPNAVFEGLAQRSLANKANWSDWTTKAREAYLATLNCPAQPSSVDMAAVCEHLRSVLPGDTVLTNGAGNFTIWPSKFLPFGEEGRLLAPQSGAMGYGVPAAIAAKITCPERTVICFAGDGDFQMNGQELATAAQHDAQPIILLLNNGIYGTIRMHQERNYPERVLGTDITNPDFVGWAKACGFHSERVEATEDFPAAFARAMKSKSGAVLELNISPEALTPRQTLSQMRQSALAAQKTKA